MNFENLLSGALGAVIVSIFDFLFLRKQNKLEDRVNTLENDKLVKLEQKLEEHVNADVSQRILTTLIEMEKRATERQQWTNGSLEVLAAKVDRALEANAKQEANIINNEKFTGNLRQDIQEHVKMYHGGVQK